MAHDGTCSAPSTARHGHDERPNSSRHWDIFAYLARHGAEQSCTRTLEDLCHRAGEVLREAKQLRGLPTRAEFCGLVFSSICGKALDNAIISKLIRGLGIAAVPHGFRSLFRDWAAERTNHPREGIVKLRLTAVSDAQHGGFTTGSSPASWGLID